MRAERCVYCGREWNVSLLASIPPIGYVCPGCEGKERARARRYGQKKPRLKAKVTGT
jgi:hypothetical protein